MSEVAIHEVSDTPVETECRHHWLIESPHGAISLGICRLCGARKEFSNSVHGRLWEDDPLSELSYEYRGLRSQSDN
jgi:hypothetical protein